MRKVLLCTTAALLIAAAGLAIAQTGTTPPATGMGSSNMVATTPTDLKWGPPPPVFEQTAQMALVSGDPSKAGLYTVRLKMPAGYKIMPHFHPTDENVTVISGTFSLGSGDKFDEATLKSLPAGGFGLLPAQMHHYAMAKTACVVQVHGMGPFALTYVNPADDPSMKKTMGK
ncbi:MAG TPA: cupin domain-containing protein [Candidatus Krumholzibacteria bacterium]|nr:cupin domain-containing protein [Candidatus Krumholzibacteria bacterium]